MAKSNRQGDEVSLDTLLEYGIQAKQRIVTLVGDIDAEAVRTLNLAVCELTARNSEAPIHLHICSHGGDTHYALAILGMMENCKVDIYTYGFGEVSSAATLLLAAGKRRFISKYSVFMHHEASYEVEGRHSAIRAQIKQAEKEEKQWAYIMESLTKKPRSFWMKEGCGIDVYFSPAMLVEYGVVDAII